MKLELLNEHDEALVDALVAGVRAHNFAHMGPERSQPLTIAARDADGALIGGVAGRTIYRQFLIDAAWVDERGRGTGLGRRLMALAEQEARSRGCLAAQVDTLAFQAPDFYRKLGFEVAGTVDGIAGSPARFFLLKRYPEPAGG